MGKLGIYGYIIKIGFIITYGQIRGNKQSLMNSRNLNPTSLAQYIRFENCDRFLRFRLNPDDEKRLLKKWGLTIQPLTPLLEASGADFEEDVASQIAQAGEDVVDLKDQSVEETIRRIQAVRKPTILLQPSLFGHLGNLETNGRADAIRIERNNRWEFSALIADIKATRQERMEHRLQVAVYANLIGQMMGDAGISLKEINGAILTIQDDGSIPALNHATPTFEIDTYLSILDRLAVLPDCRVNQILAQPFEEVFYHLSYKCDGCLYNSICMYDGAEKMDVALTPVISAVGKRVMLEAGIHSLPELADLMSYASDGSYEVVS